MEETWVKVDGFQLYEVSDQGNIRNRVPYNEEEIVDGRVICRTKWRYFPVNTYTDRYDNYKVRLNKPTGGSTVLFLAKLIASAFVANTTNGATVRHKDGNKNNNRADNLYWTCAGRLPANGASNSRGTLYGVTKDGTVEEYESQSAAARAVGGRQSNISGCLSGYAKSAYGRTWSYTKPQD